MRLPWGRVAYLAWLGLCFVMARVSLHFMQSPWWVITTLIDAVVLGVGVVLAWAWWVLRSDKRTLQGVAWLKDRQSKKLWPFDR